jgi:hypothetical protein
MYMCLAFEIFIDFDENWYVALPQNVCQGEWNESLASAEKTDTLLRAAVGTASHQHGLEASACVRRHYCVLL